MQKKKIFIEIPVPSQIQRRLSSKIAQWETSPVKWMKEENFHMTVSFVGYVDESVIPDICRKVNEAVGEMESFDLDLDVIELGPDKEHPRMIWLSGEPSTQLRKLHESIELSLGMRPEPHKEFRPHVLLGRIRKIKWDALEKSAGRRTEINEKYHAVIPVDFVSVMESKGGGAEYVSLEECSLA